MRARYLFLYTVVVGCGGGGGGGGPDGRPDGSSALVSGTAHVVHGPSVPATFTLAAAPAAPLTDGKWYVTPDTVHVQLNRINFAAAAGGMGTGADLVDCGLTFDKSAPSLSSLLDCPFSIAPGTYTGMTLFVDGTFQLQLSDAVNGIYTDSTSASLLATTAPAAGTSLVEYARPLGASGVEQLFATPLVVGDGDSVSLAIVLDAIQTLHISVSNSGTTLALTDMDQFPVDVFPTLDAPGVARYLTTANTASSYNDSLVLANILRVYYAAGTNGQPTYAFPEQTAGMINGCALPAPAYPADHATSGLGGWLGRDAAGTTCWASSRDSWMSYEAYFTLADVSSVGSSAALSCEHTTAPTPPSSGATYASGCPAITATATAQMMLVAQ